MLAPRMAGTAKRSGGAECVSLGGAECASLGGAECASLGGNECVSLGGGECLSLGAEPDRTGKARAVLPGR